MKKNIFILSLMLTMAVTCFGQVANIVGRWKTIDDKDGTAKSIVLIYKAPNGKFFGKIEKLFKNPSMVCSECEGINKDQPIQGMVIISNMVEEKGKLTGGTIIDPKSGKVYSCNISIDSSSPTKLIVRGSIDKRGWIGRSQTWIRVN